MSDAVYTTDWLNQVRNLSDAYSPRPPTQYVVDKFIETGSLNVFYGAPATMKSMVLADMAAAVVSGEDWLIGSTGRIEGYQTEQTAVLWVDMDNGKRRTDERFEAIGRHYDLPDDAPLNYLTMPRPSFKASDPGSLYSMMVLARDELGVGLVIIDNLGLVTGDVEENSAGMADIMGDLRLLTEETGAAVILIHHQRKGGAGKGRAGDALRGHSSIEASLDIALHVVREPNSNQITIQSTKTRGVDVPRTVAQFHYQHRPGTNDLELAYFTGIPLAQTHEPVKDEILTVVRKKGESMKERLIDEVQENLMAAGIEVGKNKIRNWIGELVEVSGDLTEVKRGPAKLIMAPNYYAENYE